MDTLLNELRATMVRLNLAHLAGPSVAPRAPTLQRVIPSPALADMHAEPVAVAAP